MRRVIFFKWVFFCCLSFSAIAKEGFTLSLKDVRPTMDRIFFHHIDTKQLGSKIAHRSIRLYLEQFDPNRMYLLKEEVEPYLDISSERLDLLVQDYQKGGVLEYLNLNETIQRSIYRMRKIRKEQVNRLIQGDKGAFEKELPASTSLYPLSEDELKDKVYNRLVLEVKSHLALRNQGEPMERLVEKILIHRSKKAALFEEEYLDRSEHFLALHILKAMAKSLDPHTAYYSPKEAKELLKMLAKEFCGIGVVFREDFDGVYVGGLIQHGPAETSGKIQVGDQVLSVNGQEVEGKPFRECLELVQGNIGDPIVLKMKRQEEVVDVSIVCKKISIHPEKVSYSYEPYGKGIIGKIQIPAFYDNGKGGSVFQDLREALRSLKSQGELLGVVLDFRENSGGFFNQAVKVSSLFIPGGLIVMSKYADGEVGHFRAVDGRQFFEGPMIALVSKASASATEIVSQALQDHGIALIVGDQRTYGKGSIQLQTITNTNKRGFFKVTVGRYYTPSGRCPQIRGVQGDIFVPTPLFKQNIGEKYLQFPLAIEDLNGALFHSLIVAKEKQTISLHPLSLKVSHLKPFESNWRQMLPILKKNSEYRIQNNRNYQVFLNQMTNPKPSSNKENCVTKDYGAHDLQMEESVDILKDMILIHQQKGLQ